MIIFNTGISVRNIFLYFHFDQDSSRAY